MSMTPSGIEPATFRLVSAVPQRTGPPHTPILFCTVGKRQTSSNGVATEETVLQSRQTKLKIFVVNKTNSCTEFLFYWYYDSTCFGQPFCPSSGVLSHTSALVHFKQLWWPYATRSRMELQGVPGRIRPRIFLAFGTTRVVVRQPYAPAAFTPGEIPGTHF
jgi:hypothetical protein